MDDLGTKAVVTEFAFKVVGRTRDECIEIADRAAHEFLSVVGGEPWIMLDDDWQRRSIGHGERPITLADDQGFYYTGVRKYMFNGPFLGAAKYPTHDGWKTQKQIGGDD